MIAAVLTAGGVHLHEQPAVLVADDRRAWPANSRPQLDSARLMQSALAELTASPSRRPAGDNGRSTATNGQRQGLTSSTEWHILVTRITNQHKRPTAVAPSLPHNPGDPMPNLDLNFAQFVSFMDKGFTVPPEHTIDQHPPGIPHLTDLDRSRDAFLAFKLQTLSGSGKLSIKINAITISVPFGPSDSLGRIWYETISAEGTPPTIGLHEVRNEIVANVDSGQVQVSDFKIFYHATMRVTI